MVQLGVKIGSDLLTGVGVTSWGEGRLDLVSAGAGGQLVHWWYSGGMWQGPEPLSGITRSAPAVASWGEGRLDIFFSRADGTLGTIWYDESNGGWHPKIR